MNRHPLRMLFLLCTTLLLSATVLVACGRQAEPVVVDEAAVVGEETTAEEGVAAAEEGAVAPPIVVATLRPAVVISPTVIVPTMTVGTPNTLLVSSTMLNRDFVSNEGRVRGRVDDLLIDLTDGRILFATLRHGGFLNIGVNWQPVPLRAFHLDEDDQLVLAVDRARLQALPNWGRNWPDLSNAAWDDTLTGFWRESGFDPGFAFADTTSIILWHSALVDLPVSNLELGEGTVRDLLFDLNQSRVHYVVITYAPLLGERLVAVPFEAFTTQVFQNQIAFRLHIDPEVLRTTPHFDRTALENRHLDTALARTINQYWRQHPVTNAATNAEGVVTR
jgi:sporulation protein YlmC with PRC-barrel domain